MKYRHVTYCKAIGIALMVLIHAGFVQGKDFVCLFHMPLFFIMSGYCFKDDSINNGIRYLKKKIKGIYYPYVKWGLLFLFVHNFFVYLHIYDSAIEELRLTGISYSINDILLQAKRIVIMASTEPMLGGYWFLKELFWGNLLFFIMKKYLKYPPPPSRLTSVHNKYRISCNICSYGFRNTTNWCVKKNND